MFELAKSPSANIFDATFVVIVYDLREDFILNMRSFGFDAIHDIALWKSYYICFKIASNKDVGLWNRISKCIPNLQ